MAAPGNRVAAWTIEGPNGPIVVYAVRSHKPTEVYFEWHEKGQETAGDRISRQVTGAPGRLLVYRMHDPTLAAVDTVGWIFDPHHRPDPVAGTVLEFVDNLTLEFLVDFGRRAVADDLERALDHVESLSRELEIGQRWVAACHLVEAALTFTDAAQVKVALSLVQDWAGTPDDLVLAVLAVTRPAG